MIPSPFAQPAYGSVGRQHADTQVANAPIGPDAYPARLFQHSATEDWYEDRLDQYWKLTDLRARLAQEYTLTDLSERTGGPARYVQLEETGQKIGFITPLTHNFCESCNRVRLTCTGELYMCLGQEDMADLRAPLRNNPSDDAPLEQAIRNAIAHKPKGHDFDYSRQAVDGKMSRHMSHTGG